MAQKPTFLTLLKELKRKRMLVVLLLGFSSGLPIMLLYKSLKIWLRREGIELSTIGYLSWVTVPYSFNFIWAFLFDRFTLSRLGRRRGWLLTTQIGLVVSLLFLGFGDPQSSIPFIVFWATALCFFSASQDVIVDAYRREILPEEELGVGAAIGVYGYRIGMLVASGFGLWIVHSVDKESGEAAGWVTFGQMYWVMAVCMGVGILTTLFSDEPEVDSPPPRTMFESVINPFIEFFRRDGAVILLLFILFFKIGDSMAGSMLGAFYVDAGFSNQDIAEVTSIFSFFSTMAGLFVGGALIFRYGYHFPLLAFGVLQAMSTLAFVLLAQFPTWGMLAGVVFFEDFSSGMGTAALVGFMSVLTNKRFTATQYALFASLASFGRTFFSGFAGQLIDALTGVPAATLATMDETTRSALYMEKGYPAFFVFCAVIAIPGLILLHRVWKLQTKPTSV